MPKICEQIFLSSSPHSEVWGKEIINPTCFSSHVFCYLLYVKSTRSDLCVVRSLKVLSQAERADPISPSMSLYLKINSTWNDNNRDEKRKNSRLPGYLIVKLAFNGSCKPYRCAVVDCKTATVTHFSRTQNLRWADESRSHRIEVMWPSRQQINARWLIRHWKTRHTAKRKCYEK